MFFLQNNMNVCVNRRCYGASHMILPRFVNVYTYQSTYVFAVICDRLLTHQMVWWSRAADDRHVADD